MTNKSNQSIHSQLERANAILVDLKPNLTPQDREDAQKQLYISEPTITRYLNGDAKKIDLAISLIEFFKGKISDRERKLQGAA